MKTNILEFKVELPTQAVVDVWCKLVVYRPYLIVCCKKLYLAETLVYLNLIQKVISLLEIKVTFCAILPHSIVNKNVDIINWIIC